MITVTGCIQVSGVRCQQKNSNHWFTCILKGIFFADVGLQFHPHKWA
ncbi:hypothetical protein D1AOALGA4SA_725 [Olavius algarvensis Delta 1 endosymbiont]|nr:hypothetical protein D1AOALGA4SA_725 [Olavius algarvensis Delta 1 endosymbiont]